MFFLIFDISFRANRTFKKNLIFQNEWFCPSPETSRPVFILNGYWQRYWQLKILEIFRHFLKIFAIDRRHFATPSSGRFWKKQGRSTILLAINFFFELQLSIANQAQRFYIDSILFSIIQSFNQSKIKTKFVLLPRYERSERKYRRIVAIDNFLFIATTDVVAIDSFDRRATTSCRGNRFNHLETFYLSVPPDDNSNNW